jgi:hypothetical protein
MEPNRLPAKPAQDNSALLAEMTPLNRVFLWGVLEGKSVWEAYQEAGGRGDKHAAYVLKARLDRELQAFAQARGVSKGDLLAEISKLNSIPVHIPETGLTVGQKLKLLALQDKVLDGMKPDRPNVTNIQINRYAEKKTETSPPGETTVVEAEVVQTEAQPQNSAKENPEQ